jgi:hypothetical protein
MVSQVCVIHTREDQMIRRAAAIVLALMLNPALLHAQDASFTVTVPSAAVYKGPSNVTPVIGQVSRGTVLSVSRNLGDWIKIAWPDAEDGVGYVRTSMGRASAPDAGAPATNPSPRTSSASATTTRTTPTPVRTPTNGQVTPRVRSTVRPISHIFGVGALVTPMSGLGATAQAWRHNHVGIQVGFMRDVMTSDVAIGRVTSIQFEPGVAYAPFDRVGDYIWIRPYVGSAVSVLHQTLTVATPVPMPPVSDNGIGFRAFGGGELTFASMPQFGVSADLGYRRFPTPFTGFKADPFSVSIAGHWYIK